MEPARRAQARQTRRKDFRTEEILEATRRVLARTGIAHASIELIAQEAGIAKGTVYLYFDNKETLLARAREQLLQDLVRKSRAAVQRARGSRAKLLAIARTGLAHGAEHRSFLRALADEAPLRSGPDAPPDLAAYQRLIAGVIQRGTRAGAFRKVSPRWAARALIELMRLAVLENPPLAPPSEEQAYAIVDFFLHGIGKGERR